MTLNVATELHDYLMLRAAVEGVPYQLDASWLANVLEQVRLLNGSPTIRAFGVYIEDEQLMYDEQEPSPGFFDAWSAQNLFQVDEVPVSGALPAGSERMQPLPPRCTMAISR